MLFDLRGRGRRRTIQIIYLGLALLMGGGLIFFGIGGATSGGLLDAFKNEAKTGGGVSFTKKVTAAERRAAATPSDPKVWAALARIRYQQASITGFDQNTGQFSADGRKSLAGVEQAWDRYVALNPKHPDDRTALLMVQVFGPGGLNKLDKATTAMDLVTQVRKPTAALFSQLAVLAYAAGQTRKGDLASDKAVSLAPKAQRAGLKAQLESAKSQGAANAPQGATGTTG
jgi:hypothetical protein